MAAKKEILLIEVSETGARVVKRNIEGIGKAGSSTTDQMDKLKKVLAGYISARVLKNTIMLADSYANMLNRLRVVTTGTWELHAAMEAVFRMSRETRTSLEANIDMYARIALNTKTMGLGMKDVVRFATQLNHAIILSGVTAREAQWGMVQFSQGLAAGALRGDELRAVMEQLPVVTETLTKYLGIGRGQLRKWAFEGRVTTRVIIDAFNEAEKNLAQRFGKRIPTVDQAITVLGSSIAKFVGLLDQAMQGTSSLAKAILWAADNMDTLGRFVGMAGILLGGIFLKNLIIIVAQMKLFSLAVLTVHPLAIALGVTAAAMVVFSDKIKIAKDSSATLADVFKVLGSNAKYAYSAIRKGLGNLLSGLKIQKEFEVTLQSVTTDAATFIDKFLGLFIGAGQVVAAVFSNIPNYAKAAWNGVLTDVEFIYDVITAYFKSIGDAFTIFGLGVKTGMLSTAEAIQQTLMGNVDQAKKYAAQAALSYKQAIEGFGDLNLLQKNLESATSTDSLSGVKFQVEKAGETLGEAFMRGFDMSTVVASGLTDLFDRAKDLSTATTGGPSPEAEIMFSPTPVQSQLLKDMLGDVSNVNNQMRSLKELWTAINTEQPGTEGMKATLDQVDRKMAELKLKSLSKNTDIVSGFQRGFTKLGLEITDFADMAEKTITNAFSSMEDALVSFVTTGKVDFKGLVDSMLGDLTRLLARKALVGMLGALMPGSSLLGLLAGGSGGAGVSDLPAKALGGPVSPGLSYLVGERRPEIFQPAQPGHIVPNPAAAQQPAQEGAVVIVNAIGEDEVEHAMASHEGKRIIRNEIRLARG